MQDSKPKLFLITVSDTDTDQKTNNSVNRINDIIGNIHNNQSITSAFNIYNVQITPSNSTGFDPQTQEPQLQYIATSTAITQRNAAADTTLFQPMISWSNNNNRRQLREAPNIMNADVFRHNSTNHILNGTNNAFFDGNASNSSITSTNNNPDIIDINDLSGVNDHDIDNNQNGSNSVGIEAALANANNNNNNNHNNNNHNNNNSNKSNNINDGRFECNQCSKRFHHQSNLKVHKKVHGPSAYACDICHRKFARYSNLKQHMRVHTNERPFKCNQCGKGFKQSHSLVDHLRLHTGEKPFKCDLCGRGFTVKHNMEVHRRVHTGEKPYQCTICYKRFSSKSGLNQHTKIHKK